MQTVKNNRGKTGHSAFREKVTVPFYDEQGDVYSKIATLYPVSKGRSDDQQLFEQMRERFETGDLLVSAAGKTAEGRSRKARDVLAALAQATPRGADEILKSWISRDWIVPTEKPDPLSKGKQKVFYVLGSAAPENSVTDPEYSNEQPPKAPWPLVSPEEHERRERLASETAEAERVLRADLEERRSSWLAKVEASSEPRRKHERLVHSRAIDLLRNSDLLYELTFDAGLTEEQIFAFDSSLAKTHPRQGLLARLEDREFRVSEEGAVEAQRRNGAWVACDTSTFASESGAPLITERAATESES